MKYIVLDLQGRTLIEGNDVFLNGGYHEFSLNMENYSSGLYFYQYIINDKFSNPQKMVLLK